jgi:hypothetical protein
MPVRLAHCTLCPQLALMLPQTVSVNLIINCGQRDITLSRIDALL